MSGTKLENEIIEINHISTVEERREMARILASKGYNIASMFGNKFNGFALRIDREIKRKKLTSEDIEKLISSTE